MHSKSPTLSCWGCRVLYQLGGRKRLYNTQNTTTRIMNFLILRLSIKVHTYSAACIPYIPRMKKRKSLKNTMFSSIVFTSSILDSHKSSYVKIKQPYVNNCWLWIIMHIGSSAINMLYVSFFVRNDTLQYNNKKIVRKCQ